MPPAQRDHPPVRDDERVDMRLCRDDDAFDFSGFALEHYRVERQVAAHRGAAGGDRLAAPAYLWQVSVLEVDTAPCTHVEGAEAEVYGVRASVDRRLQAGEVAGRGQYLRRLHHSEATRQCTWLR